MNLLNNLNTVANAFGAVGFDYDNEDQIGNVSVIVELTKALYDVNNVYQFSFCPYGPSAFSSRYWIDCLEGIYTALGTQPVVGFNLQCYSGGAGSDPDGWAAAVTAKAASTGINDANSLIRPGLAAIGTVAGQGPACTPAQVTTKLQNWNSKGGWIWDSETVLKNGASPSLADYASAITSGS